MQRHTRRTWQTCGGAVLLALSVFGVYYGAKASLAQYAYYRAKYGDARGDVDSIARLCEQAHRLYPHNYRFCAWTAASAWKARGTGDTPERVATADNWCAVGLAVNPLHRPLRLLRARLLQRQAPGEAAAYWARYVEWHFWEPANHAILAELHASPRCDL